MRFNMLLASAVAAAVLSPALPAATLEVVSGTRGGTIASTGAIGQSFTAIDSALTSFGFQFQSLNPDRANDPITFTLRAGEGLTGAIVTTTSFTLPASINSRTPTWFDFDITGTSVAVGSVYTAVLTTTASARNAVTFGPNLNIFTGQPLTGDAYAGGKLIATVDPDANGYCNRSGICDLSFRVTGTTPAAVPEPAGWAMMVGGFGLLGAALRRRRPAAALAL